MSDRCSV